MAAITAPPAAAATRAETTRTVGETSALAAANPIATTNRANPMAANASRWFLESADTTPPRARSAATHKDAMGGSEIDKGGTADTLVPWQVDALRRVCHPVYGAPSHDRRGSGSTAEPRSFDTRGVARRLPADPAQDVDWPMAFGPRHHRSTISRVPRRRSHDHRRRTSAVRSATRHTGGVGQDARQVCRTRASCADPAAYRRN